MTMSGQHQLLLSRSVQTAEMPSLSRELSAADIQKCERHDFSSNTCCSGQQGLGGVRGKSDLRAVRGRPG